MIYSFFKILLILFVLITPKLQAASTDTIKILLTGDIYPGGHAQSFLVNEPSYPYKDLNNILKEGDILIGNLETPLTTSTETFMDKTYTLKSSTDIIHSLKAGGFDAFSLANNHIMDFGWKGVKNTLKLLEKYKIKYSGVGKNLESARKPAVIQKNGFKVALLSYNNSLPLEFNADEKKPGTSFGQHKYITRDIKNIVNKCDIIIVSFHWSEELMETPKDYQKKLARTAIDSGAHIVFGHHPHVIQSVETYKDGIIAYSLGNFIFGSYSDKVSEGLLMQITAGKSKLHSTHIIPININNLRVNFKPGLFSQEEAQQVLEKIISLSQPHETQITIENNKGIIRHSP
ncbi:MAG: CapA family protein [Elusimicrobiota bacterium]